MTRLRPLLFFAFLLALSACQSADEARSMRLPLEVTAEGTYVVRAQVGGSGPFRLVLDTGSEFSALKQSHVAGLEVPVQTQSVLVHGLFSARHARLTRDIDVSAGQLATRVPMLVLDEDGYSDMSADGLFGLESLGTQRTGARYAQIDLTEQSLILSSYLRTSDRGEINAWTPLDTDLPAGAHLLAFEIVIDGVRGRALLDTGLRYSLINDAFAERLALRRRTRLVDIIDTHGEEKGLRVVSVPDLRAMGLHWPRASVLVYDAAAFDFLGWNEAPAALIGVNMLQHLRLIIDTEAGRITALPEAPRRQRFDYITPRIKP
ncbi:MAG: aspartyl protease family protein [Pseudomonadota bacterium]